MPVTIHEFAKGSRDTEVSIEIMGQRKTLAYVIRGTQSEATALTTAEATRPASTTVGVFTLYPVKLDLRRVGFEIWHATYTYSPYEQVTVGDIEESFDTDGGTIHITQALSHLGDFAPPGDTANNYGGLINVTNDSVEGIDIEVPGFAFELRGTLAAASITNAYKLQLAELTKTVNIASWKGFPAGTVMFKGASGGLKKSQSEGNITYKFTVESIDAAHTDANGIALPNRNGWDLIWYRATEVIDGTTNDVVRRSVSAHIDRVYYYSDFTLIGLG